MSFTLGMMLDLYAWHNNYAHAYFDDFDLDARSHSQWVGKGKHSALNYLNNKASNKHYNIQSD